MKNIFPGFIFFFLLLLGISCNKTKEGRPVETLQIEDNQEFDNEHNAKNSLDYKGTYNGILPSGLGDSLDVTIEIGDSTFVKTVKTFKKKSHPIISTGVYVWNREGNTISLNGVAAPNQYFVGENTLNQLDSSGKKIENAESENFTLSKTAN